MNHYTCCNIFVVCRHIQDVSISPLSMTVLLRRLFRCLNLVSLWCVSNDRCLLLILIICLFMIIRKREFFQFFDQYIFFLLDFLLFIIFIFQPITALPKRGRKCQEDNTKLAIIESNTLYLASSEKVDLSTTEVETRKNMRQDITVGHRQKQGVSSESVRLRECSINHQHSASKKSKQVLEKEPLSSCDSVTRLSLAESHISVQTLERDALSLKENVRASSNVVSDPPKYSKAEAKDTCSLNVCMNQIYVFILKLFNSSASKHLTIF